MGSELEQILRGADRLFDGFFEWLNGQYDAESGGFYYARSSRRSGLFTPDIESTAQALNIMERCGLLERMSEARNRTTIQFFQSKQDRSTGLFFDADPNMRLDDVMVGRALGYSMMALEKFGAKPLYPLPERSEATPDYMASPAAYRAWLQSVSLANSWRGCDRLSNSAPYLTALPPADREPYVREAFAFLAEMQDPSSGLWGEGSRYVRLSGTFKLHIFYKRFDVPIPRQAAIYRSILDILRHDEAFDMCYIRNPISLLAAMRPAMTERELEEIARLTLANMAKLKQADGGFSRELGHSPPAPNVAQVKDGEFYPDMPAAVPLGLGEAEGDMNAGTQAVLIRYTLRELAGLPAAHLPADERLFIG